MGRRGGALPPALLLAGLLAAGGRTARDQPVVYEISTRPWLYSLAESGVQARCGQYVCLRDVPRSRWQALAEDSIDMVWLMGVWQLGDFGLQHDRSPAALASFRRDLPDVEPADVIGSPYAVQNYTVNSDIGTAADLAAVRATLRSLGMGLMLDFVPNHAAVDSVLVEEHPSIFLQRPAAGSFPDGWWIERGGTAFAFGRGPYATWTDTLQYNYWHRDTLPVMVGVLQAVASQADAVRCDMAMLVLNDVIQRTWGGPMKAGGLRRPRREFWEEAIAAVRVRHPDVLFVAEAYDYGFTSPPEKQKLQSLGFDVVYDKTVLDNLDAGNLDSLKGYIGSQRQAFFRHTAHFVENHDEPRSVAALGGPEQAFAGAVVAATLPGLRLFYFGQFDGLSARLVVQLRRAVAQAPDEALHRRYTALLRALADDVFHEGSWTFVQVPRKGTGWRLSAWRWASRSGEAKRLVVVNFSDGQGRADVRLPDARGGGGGGDVVAVAELLTGARYQRSAKALRSKGLTCSLGPWTAQIFAYDASGPPSSLSI